MADTTVAIDVIDKSIPIGNNRNIAVINKPNPVYGYEANAEEVAKLIQIPMYYIYEAGTQKLITGNNFYDYFPDEGGGGGGSAILVTKDVTTNGTYNASSDHADGYSKVNVNVANTYTNEDEGKVVDNGTLVAQTAMAEEVTENGTVDTTLYNSVTVNVPSGGGLPSTDVVFYDYDGSVVATYSAADFAKLSAMPANPTHEGLTAQGWNWSLADAKDYVATYGKLNIGQMYITSDGKTRLYISLPEGRTSPILQLYLNADSELDIDWGDGSTHSTFTTTSAEYKSERHEYSSSGDYVIAVTVVNGGFVLQSSSTTNVSSILWNGNDSTSSPDVAYNNAIKKIEIGNSVTSIGQKAFQKWSSLSSVTIPDSVTSIANYAFYYCYSLSSVTIPDGVTSIGDNAFNNCNSLTSITIPDSVTSIGTYAFYYCSPLSSITIPDGVTSIGEAAFSGCKSLSSVTIPDGVTSIAQYVFTNCNSLSSVTIPDSVTSIGNSVFEYCNSLSSITIPDGVTSIGNSVFNNCNSLTSITIPDGVTSIGQYVFVGCYSLSSVTIPDSVTSIGNSAFSSCYSLSSVTIPDGVTSIGSGAFSGCSYMSYIKFESTTPPTVANSNAWNGVSTSTKILVPTGTLETYKTASKYPNPSTYTYEEY